MERGTVSVYLEKEDYLVLLKGAGIPSAPLRGGARSAFEEVAGTYPEICSVRGKNAAEGGLLHRIDAETAGLLLVARTQRFYDAAERAQKEGTFIKYYTAYCSIPEKSENPRFAADELPYVLESRFRPFGEKGAMVRPVFDDAGRADRKKAGTTVYRTEVISLSPYGNSLRICCRIQAGFRHQVRSHLAAAGYPVIGDRLYGKDSKGPEMLFFASGLELKGEGLSVRIPQDLTDEMAASACLTSLTR